jgi:hypothetical protein
MTNNATPNPSRLGPVPRRDSVHSLLSLLHGPDTGGDGCRGDKAAAASVVRGIDGSGSRHETRVAPELEVVALSGLGIHTVALDALARNPPSGLREVSLAANALTTIDLGPLAGCTALRVLALNSNKLRVIDLAPLRACLLLERLWLHDNALEHIDLTPLRTSTALRSLYLDDNAIHNTSIDLAPLAGARHLRSLRLAGNRLAGSLDVTPLLSVPALSQFHYSPGVKLVATGDSTLARVSPALRRCVLDITFTPAASDSMETGCSTSPTSPSQAPIPCATRSPRRLTPPCLLALQSPPRATSPKKPSERPALTALPLSSGAAQGAASYCALTVSSPRRQDGESEKRALSPPLTTVVSSLLIGFRRLSRYAVEDTMARCGKISMRAVEAEAALADTATILEAHVVILHSPTERTLRHVCIVAGTASVPVKVIGTERYRSTNEHALASLFSNMSTSFFVEPLTTEAAQIIFQAGVACACGRSRGDAPHHLSSSVSAPELALLANHAFSPSASAAGMCSDKEPSGRTSSTRIQPLSIARLDQGCSPANGGSRGPGHLRPPPSPPPIELSLLGKPAGSVWTDITGRLTERRSSCGYVGSPRLSPSGSFSSLPSLPPTPVGPGMKTHNTNRLRGERAAIEVIFHDLGGTAGMEEFAEIARACGMPKCAGRLLFAAVLAAVGAVEVTTPETGVPETDPKNASATRLSLIPFLEYWEARLLPYDGESRLYNIIVESEMSKLSTLHASPMPLAISNVGLVPSVKPLEGDRDSLRDLRRQRSAPIPLVRTDIPQPHDRELQGCDAGVGDLITEFMRGRSSRFGMFCLVKQREAVCIGTSLVLLALRGESGGRVGGFARPIGARELRKGKLNSSLIAAESGIFEGVTSDLSMDRLRTIKGNYASDADSDAIAEAEGCALNYWLCEDEVHRYNARRRLLYPRGVHAVLLAHCRSRTRMNLAEFALLHSATSNMTSISSADYFFTVIDFDHNDYWSLADVKHFHQEKEREFVQHNMAMSGIDDVWACLCDMIRPAKPELGIARKEFLKLSGKNRRTVIQSILFREDEHATLNIRKTMEMEGRRDGTVAAAAQLIS